MELQAGAFIEPVMSQSAAQHCFQHSGSCIRSPATRTKTLDSIPGEIEFPEDHSEQLENPVHACEERMHDSEYVLNQDVQEQINSDLESVQSSLLETDAMIKLPRYVSEALYVTDLHPMVAEYVSSLYWLFKLVGNVSVIKVMKKPADTFGRPPLCYAFVNFQTVEEACRAWQTFNYHVWMGLPMRIMFSNLDQATRYNENANIIITNLEESIDSHLLHQTFAKLGVVLSSKVEQDPTGISTGRGFVQFQDEEDAKLAIENVNNKEMMGKRVYVGPFMRRTFHLESGMMEKNSTDPNPVYYLHIPVDMLSPVLESEALPNGGVSKHGSCGISTGSSSNPKSVSHVSQLGSFEPAYEFYHLEDTYEALSFQVSNATESLWNSTTQSRNQAKKEKELRRKLKRATAAQLNKVRRLAIIEQALQELKKEKMLSTSDSFGIPSSEPWPPQPWSVETLKARLANASCPDERRAMLGGTLFPLVSKQTKYFISEVTNELVKLDIKEIVKFMELPEEALYQKVEEVKRVVCERIKDLPLFFPATPPQTDPSASGGVPAGQDSVDTGLDSVDTEEVKHAIFEEVNEIPSFVSTSALSEPPAEKDPETRVTVLGALHFPVPVLPEFLPAQAAPGFGLLKPSITYPLLVLPYFPYPVYARKGTGFYEPRVCNKARVYSKAEACFQRKAEACFQRKAEACFQRLEDEITQFIYEACENPVQDEEPVVAKFVQNGPAQALADQAKTMKVGSHSHEVQAQEESSVAQEEPAQMEDMFADEELAHGAEKSVHFVEHLQKSAQEESAQE